MSTRAQIQAAVDAIADNEENTALEVRTAFNSFGWIISGMCIEMDVPTSYIAANFDSTGLGTNEMIGWAIRNGNNGTRNAGGRTSIGYDPTNYPTLGALLGEKDHTLSTNEMPIHEHLNGVANGQTSLFVYGGTTTGMPGSATAGIDEFGEPRTYQGRTSTAGGGLPHNNMQPSIVTLKIMKL